MHEKKKRKNFKPNHHHTITRQQKQISRWTQIKNTLTTTKKTNTKRKKNLAQKKCPQKMWQNSSP